MRVFIKLCHASVDTSPDIVIAEFSAAKFAKNAHKAALNSAMTVLDDYGCDPTWVGSDHTREHVPILAFGPDIKAGSIGLRKSFSDIGQSIAKHSGLASLKYGVWVVE